MAQLYPQVLGSLFVASYGSQGYGGSIRTRLHAVWLRLIRFASTCRTLKLVDRSVGRSVCTDMYVFQNGASGEGGVGLSM
jgi:hypothetical protein